jgi:hypothetical protein
MTQEQVPVVIVGDGGQAYPNRCCSNREFISC